MATAVPSPLTAAYCLAMRDDCYARMEEARRALSISGQVHSITHQALADLERQAEYWERKRRAILARAAGAGNATAAVATWS